jgi:hypothetical protein
LEEISVEKPNRQVHLGCAEDYPKQLLKFFDCGVVRRSSIELNHAPDNISGVVPFEVLLDILFTPDWVGDRIEKPFLGKIPSDDVAHPVFEKTTSQSSSTLPSHGIWYV